MNEDKRLFVMRLDNKLKVLKNTKFIRKLLSVKDIHIKKVIRKLIEILINSKYQYNCLKCYFY